MLVTLKLDDKDNYMVLMYAGDYLLGAAHIDCFEHLDTKSSTSTQELLSNFTEIEVKLELVNPELYLS